MNISDARTLGLIGAVLVLLGSAWGVVKILKRRPRKRHRPRHPRNLRPSRSGMVDPVCGAGRGVSVRHVATLILFGLISFWALREFITLTPTRPGDHRTLFWVFFLITPLQFILVGSGHYGLYSIMIPVYAFLFVPARIALAGDFKRFLERIAKIQSGLLICVYCLSYAPALLMLKLPALDNGEADTGGGVRLLFFFILIVQLSDALQYAWSHVPSRHVIVPTINTSRTWEGLLGGTASVALIGAVLWWATPFHGGHWWMAAVMSAVISLMGFAGCMTMSAIKRDRGVKDYGTLVEGHGGVLDRIDSLCFAAPVFFHCTRCFLVLTNVVQ